MLSRMWRRGLHEFIHDEARRLPCPVDFFAPRRTTADISGNDRYFVQIFTVYRDKSRRLESCAAISVICTRKARKLSILSSTSTRNTCRLQPILVPLAAYQTPSPDADPVHSGAYATQPIGLEFALQQVCNAEMKSALMNRRLVADIRNLRRISERPSADLRYRNYYLDYGQPGQVMLFSVRVVIRTLDRGNGPRDVYCAEIKRTNSVVDQLLSSVNDTEPKRRFLHDAELLHVQQLRAALLEEGFELNLAIVDSYVIVFTLRHASGLLSAEEENRVRLLIKSQFLHLQKVVHVHNLSVRPLRSVSESPAQRLRALR